MPKTSLARIRLYLKLGKVLADGSSPIMLMCSFNGRKEVSTGCSCTEKYWSKKDECIKKGYPNWIMLNSMIKKMKDDAIAIRDEYERLGQAYTPSMILCPRKSLSASQNDLKALIQQYISEKGIEAKTIEKWWVVYRSVIRYYGREVIVNEIDESFCRQYGRWMESEGLSVGSIRSYLGKLGAICHYAIGKGIMNSYPFDNWKYHKDYQESKSELYIHHRSMEIMIDMFLDECIERDGKRWRYREGVIERLLDIHSELYSHYLYVVGYYLKGISPTDISLLKKRDIKTMMIRDINCYAIDGHRQKTGQLYKIRVRQNCLLSNVLVQTMLMFNQGEYFLPTLCGFNGDKKKRVNNLYTYHSENLVRWFQKVNERIVELNVAGDSIPLIDLDCRFYSYRHSYIMKEIQKPTVNLLALAQSVGKSSHSLHQYISLLGDVDLI
jgi:hypothetical protein